jgi:Zn-dependent protease with chaperone function
MVSARHWDAAGHDGMTTEPIALRVAVARGAVVLQAAGDEASGETLRRLPERWPFERIAIGQGFEAAARVIDWPGERWTLHVLDHDASFDAALRAAGWRPGWIARWQASRWGAALAAAVLVALVVWLDRVGIGVAAQAATPMVPAKVDQHLDRLAREWLQKHWLAPTTLPADRRGLLHARFAALAKQVDPAGSYELRFTARRDQPDFVNALALPGGTVYLFDALVRCLDDEEASAVLAHELAHVRERHAMQHVLRSTGGLALASVLFSDWSSVVGNVAAGLSGLAYSRDAEREADAIARQTLEAIGLPGNALGRAFRKMQGCGPQVGELPAIFSTHPPTEERIKAGGAAP